MATSDQSHVQDELSSTPDMDLVARHRYGDESAFDDVYRQYASMVYNLCLRMTAHRQQAEDFTQEIFLRIHRHLGRFSGRSALKTWIYQVALNYCRSKLSRKRYSMQPIAEEFEDEGVRLVETRRGPEENTLAADAARRVALALRRVKPAFREAVVLRDIEGLSYDQIAEVLGVRIGTVRSRIARGRERLRVVLEKEP